MKKNEINKPTFVIHSPYRYHCDNDRSMLFLLFVITLVVFIDNVKGSTPHEGLVETLAHEVSVSVHGLAIGGRDTLESGGKLSFSKDSLIVQNVTNELTLNVSDFEIIPCQSMDDYYTLLYRVCIQSIQCSELYYLTQPAVGDEEDPIQTENDIRKFKYQLLTTNIFIVVDGEVSFFNSTLLTINVTTKPFIIQETWPDTWFPPFIIQSLDSNPLACQSLDITLVQNRTFVYSALYLLQTYKSYLANQNYCSSHNERLIIDANNQFYCVCKLGKDCNYESNFRKASIFLQVALLVAIVIAIIAIIMDSSAKLEKLSFVRNKHKYE